MLHEINLELLERDKNISTITFMDIQDKVLRQETNPSQSYKLKVNVSDLSAGIYLIKVKDQNGQTYVGKMIKN